MLFLTESTMVPRRLPAAARLLSQGFDRLVVGLAQRRHERLDVDTFGNTGTQSLGELDSRSRQVGKPQVERHTLERMGGSERRLGIVGRKGIFQLGEALVLHEFASKALHEGR